MSNGLRLLRLFDVLEYLIRHPEGRSASQIGNALSLAPSSAHDLLTSMVKVEILSLGEGRLYTLGSRSFRLGARIVDSNSARRVARKFLPELARVLDEDVYLAIASGDRVFYVDRYYGSQPINVDVRVGSSLYLHCTAVGKLFASLDPHFGDLAMSSPMPRLTEHTITDRGRLAAELDVIRASGLSLSREEGISGVVGLACMIHDAHGRPEAALHVSILRERATKEYLRRCVDVMRECVVRMERDLGGTVSQSLVNDAVLDKLLA